MSPPDTGSSRRPPKRKADLEGEPLQRKRAQNRISQQCLREKNTAYIRSLERTVEVLQRTASDDNGGERQQDRYATLVDAHLKLIQENRRLEDALFRLRKKLLSLSNSASTAADDAVFDSILQGGDDVQRSSSHKRSQNCQGAPVGQLELDVCNQQIPQLEFTELSGNVTFTQDLDDRATGACTENITQNNDSLETAAFWDFGQDAYEQGEQQALPIIALDPKMLEMDATSLSHLLLSTSPRPPILSQQSIAITSPTIFGAKILDACRQCIKRENDSLFSTTETLNIFSKNLIAAATNLVACCMGLESYIYGVNGAQYIEKVLSWRLGLETKYDVPSPFKPTPLQAKHPNHSWSIDLLNWSDVRDQLVLEQESLDLDSMIKDIILHSVIEQPQQGVAVGVHDIFQNQILRRDKTPQSQTPLRRTFLSDSPWVFFEVNLEDQSLQTLSTTDPVEAALVAELQRRMESGSSAGNNHSTLSSPIGATNQGNKVALYFGLDNMAEWKLSKEFAAKYSFLDCSGAVSTCDLAPSSAIFYW